ncbi:hypothetical protein FKW77_005812 [Venturia effusa]|uniref:Uncharacterized protein n=1 Tax=Venturia effusa TaxID=50376 RepID=A0A517LKA5_9PEZI|nr:hypothetical protein FKW77_005812 [Venturia effusa]
MALPPSFKPPSMPDMDSKLEDNELGNRATSPPLAIEGKKRTSFLDLPAELRNAIYHIALQLDNGADRVCIIPYTDWSDSIFSMVDVSDNLCTGGHDFDAKRTISQQYTSNTRHTRHSYHQFYYIMTLGRQTPLGSAPSVPRNQSGICWVDPRIFPETANFTQATLRGWSDQTTDKKGWTADLSRVSRQVSHESQSLLYARHLCFLTSEVVAEFLKQIGDNIVLLESIEVLQDGVEDMRSDQELCYAMLAKAAKLQVLTLPWFDDDLEYILRGYEYLPEDFDEEKNISYRMGRSKDTGVPMKLTGEEVADIVYPATRVWFESMRRQGRHWEDVLSLAKNHTLQWGDVSCTYEP